MGHGVAAKPTVRYDAVAPESDERHLEELIKDYINMLPRLLALGMLALLLTACDSSFSPPSQINEELAARYKQLSCSVVLVLSAHERGTGFFIDSDGTLMTAAHVPFDETWTADSDKPSLRLSSKHNLRVVFTDERIVPLQVDDSDSVTIKNA